MKKIYYSLVLLLGGMFMINTSCSDDEKDTMAPGQISNVRFVPNYGGGYFLYDIPEDPDFLYVRADYTVDSGEKVSKTSSTYNDTLFVEGFGQVKEYEVKNTKEKRYIAEFEYKDVQYQLKGIMEKDEFEKILKNLFL